MPNPTPPHPPEQTERHVRRRLLVAGASIALAIGALALVDQLRNRPSSLAPPHEPSQVLITTPAPESDALADRSSQPDPPPPPKVVNNETLPSPPRPGAPATAPHGIDRKGSAAPAPSKIYVVQVGIFGSRANAQALQKQLQRAGIPVHLETRVQLGPFKDKRDAEKALARAKKLGIEAVLLSSR